jgi:DNA polymerase-3 subunit epsilon
MEFPKVASLPEEMTNIPKNDQREFGGILISSIIPYNYASSSSSSTMKVTYNLRSRLVYVPITEPEPSGHGLVLFFDTETTGLFPRKKINLNSLDTLNTYPHIIQLAYELYDSIHHTTVESYNQYIRIDDSVEIEPGALKVHGISHEKLDQEGIPIKDALQSFYRAYTRAQRVVAHNIEFDKNMIRIEMIRNQKKIKNSIPSDQLFMDAKDEYCTMKHGIDICDLWIPSKIPVWVKLSNNDKIIYEKIVVNGDTVYMIEKRVYKKNPRLLELYQTLYGKEYEGKAHDAMGDVEACKLCYVRMV